jgi:hypothetical protein
MQLPVYEGVEGGERGSGSSDVLFFRMSELSFGGDLTADILRAEPSAGAHTRSAASRGSGTMDFPPSRGVRCQAACS